MKYTIDSLHQVLTALEVGSTKTEVTQVVIPGSKMGDMQTHSPRVGYWGAITCEEDQKIELYQDEEKIFTVSGGASGAWYFTSIKVYDASNNPIALPVGQFRGAIISMSK